MQLMTPSRRHPSPSSLIVDCRNVKMPFETSFVFEAIVAEVILIIEKLNSSVTLEVLNDS
jgi:hypothetical protein